jgi:predicted sugar kinase
MKQLEISREALDAYEKRTGFSGIGHFLIERGYFVLKERGACREKQ